MGRPRVCSVLKLFAIIANANDSGFGACMIKRFNIELMKSEDEFYLLWKVACTLAFMRNMYKKYHFEFVLTPCGAAAPACCR